PLASLDEAITLVGPNTGISTSLGLLDARGPALASALSARGFTPRQPRNAAGRLRPLASVTELQAWLDQGPLLMDGASWFGDGHCARLVREGGPVTACRREVHRRGIATHKSTHGHLVRRCRMFSARLPPTRAAVDDRDDRHHISDPPQRIDRVKYPADKAQRFV